MALGCTHTIGTHLGAKTYGKMWIHQREKNNLGKRKVDIPGATPSFSFVICHYVFTRWWRM